MTAARRLAAFEVATLSAEQRALYDSIVSARSVTPQAFSVVDETGRLEGPFNAMLLRPRLGHALQALGAEIRFGGALTDRCREIAILVVAAAWGSRYERTAHEAVGAMVGLSDDELDATASADYDVLTDPDERAVAELTSELTRDGALSDEQYADACGQLGPAVLFELTTLVGYYATLALQLRVFHRPSGDEPLDIHAPKRDDESSYEH